MTQGYKPKSQLASQEYWLEKSARENTWGFSTSLFTQGTGLPALNGQSLLNLDLPTWMARPWTLNMLRVRYQTGTLSAAGTASPNPDAQTVGDNIQVQLQWGVGGVMERVLFDYPRSGGSVCFHASVVRVGIFTPPVALGGGIPFNTFVGGFLAPGTRGGSSQDVYPSVVFTDLPQTVNNAGTTTQLLVIPDRARAYRMIPVQNTNSTSATIKVRQQTGFFSDLTIDYGLDAAGETLQVSDGGVAPTFHNFPYRQNWIPLVRQAEILRFDLVGNGIVTLVPQYLLDLG